jgi:hypothetical protein
MVNININKLRFEVYKEDKDGSTETVFSSEDLKKCLDYQFKNKDLKIDLWVDNRSLVAIDFDLEKLDKFFLDSEYITQEQREDIIETIYSFINNK